MKLFESKVTRILLANGKSMTSTFSPLLGTYGWDDSKMSRTCLLLSSLSQVVFAKICDSAHAIIEGLIAVFSDAVADAVNAPLLVAAALG